jgi:hypothetical protein
MSEKIETNEEKLEFIIKHLALSNSDIASKFGVSAGTVSKMKTPYNSTLKKAYLHAFENIYGIPYKIFEDKNINTKERIIEVLEQPKKRIKDDVFYENRELLEHLVGNWYAYFYPSNPFAEIYSIKTTIRKDGTVTDENGNHGRVYFGKMQSMIIKEAYNSKNLVSITFDNMQVAYGMFPFTLVSKRNHVNRKMCNFGFFADRELNLDIVKKILGDVEEVQLKMNCDFGERISEFIEIEG